MLWLDLVIVILLKKLPKNIAAATVSDELQKNWSDAGKQTKSKKCTIENIIPIWDKYRDLSKKKKKNDNH